MPFASRKAAGESLGAPGREQLGESSHSVRSPRSFFGCPLELPPPAPPAPRCRLQGAPPTPRADPPGGERGPEERSPPGGRLRGGRERCPDFLLSQTPSSSAAAAPGGQDAAPAHPRRGARSRQRTAVLERKNSTKWGKKNKIEEAEQKPESRRAPSPRRRRGRGSLSVLWSCRAAWPAGGDAGDWGPGLPVGAARLLPSGYERRGRPGDALARDLRAASCGLPAAGGAGGSSAASSPRAPLRGTGTGKAERLSPRSAAVLAGLHPATAAPWELKSRSSCPAPPLLLLTPGERSPSEPPWVPRTCRRESPGPGGGLAGSPGACLPRCLLEKPGSPPPRRR